MLKPLREEQADMRKRWSDPSYQWANDSALRRKFDRRHQPEVPSSVQSTGREVAQGTQKEGEPK
jgi:hypothetical protein